MEEEKEIIEKALDFMNTLEEFLFVLDHIDDHWDYLYKSVKNTDLERIDLLHQNELAEKVNAIDMCNFYKNLKEVALRRRKLKDDTEVLEPLKKYVANNKGLSSKLHQVLKEMNKVIKNHQERVYKPRVRTDLTICPKEEDPIQKIVDTVVEEFYEEQQQEQIA